MEKKLPQKATHFNTTQQRNININSSPGPRSAPKKNFLKRQALTKQLTSQATKHETTKKEQKHNNLLE